MPYQDSIRAWFDAHRAAMLEDIAALCRIQSDRAEPLPDMPYGEGPFRALLAGQALCEREGFATRLYDNRVCTADLSDKPAGLDILAHLDVVPAPAEKWTVCQPFDPVVKDGKIYGRGTSDDKGPAVAALYAMACVRDLHVPLARNARLILGSDEECGSSDIEVYYAAEPEAPMTFSPDADFPLINCERGMFRPVITADYPECTALPRVLRVDAGVKTNVVPDAATAVVEGYTPAQLQPYCDAAAQQTGAQYLLSGDEQGLHITCKGVGGHAAHPAGANNALTALLVLLASLPLAASPAHDRLRAVAQLFPHGDWDGRALGIELEDEASGKLTISFTIFHYTGTHLQAEADSRCPICAGQDNLVGQVNRVCAELGLTNQTQDIRPPHYVPGDGPFVRTLLDCYETWTGEKGECIAIGGGTYVHELKNGVAFGAAFPGVDNRMHGPDEFAVVEQLLTAGMIYADAIIRLCGEAEA